MTIDQTRLMAVEFERRINAIDPSTESINKLDTDTIFSYLNQYQQQYVLLLYLLENQSESGSRGAIKLSDATKCLILHSIIYPIEVYNTDTTSSYFKLPSNYYSYIRSNSVVNGTYKNNKTNKTVSNAILKLDDVSKAITQYYNSDGILRNPLVCLDRVNPDVPKGCLLVIHDKYTNILYIELVYFKEPNRFNIIDNIPCELPYECFDDLVSGAVELYFLYRYKIAIASDLWKKRANKKENEQ